MPRFTRFGQNSPVVQIMLQSTVAQASRFVDQLADAFGSAEIPIAILGQAIGQIVGKIQAINKQHMTECEKCAAIKSDFREIFLKNFDEGYKEGVKEIEAEHAQARMEANVALERIIKGDHGNKK